MGVWEKSRKTLSERSKEEISLYFLNSPAPAAVEDKATNLYLGSKTTGWPFPSKKGMESNLYKLDFPPIGKGMKISRCSAFEIYLEKNS